MKVILFDIDKTLVHDGGAGKKALIFSFKKIFGIDHDFGVMAGKTDSSILQKALRINHINESDSIINNFKEYYFELLAEFIKQDLTEKKIFPGIYPLLSQLKKSRDIKIGILTGNWKTGAYIKLTHFGLKNFFGFGAFGDDSIHRDDLLFYALKRCNGCVEQDLKDVIIIGDTPSDIQCARTHGAKSIGVATGRYSTRALIQEEADLVLSDLAETEYIISWILKHYHKKSDTIKKQDLQGQGLII